MGNLQSIDLPRLDDGAKLTVDVNTLLEPTNNNSAQQNDASEIFEVSTQLNQIKKKHDEAKKHVIAKQDELDHCKQEIEQLSVQATQSEGPTFQISSRLEQLQDQLLNTQQRIEEENLTQCSYRFMLDRMEKDYISSQLKSTDLQLSIKSKA